MRLTCLLLALLLPATARGEEGMWLFNQVPVDSIRTTYGFEVTRDWLDHLRLSSVRIGGGASGSFVSPHGLILTNHHVGAHMIDRLSTAKRNLLKDGFYARSLADEIRCPGLEASVLTGIEDVTARVHAAVPADLGPDQAVAARRAAIARIEEESKKHPEEKLDVVSLHRGAIYHLYRYQRHSDVRLVCAPDVRSATFGGDPDNFEFPRHCLDFCFFRVYQEGKPAATPRFLRWNPAGAAENELTFVSGHPGRTNRSLTVSQLITLRDETLPWQLDRAWRAEAMLRAWAERDVENARRAQQSITGIQNGRKAVRARLDGLLDPALFSRRTEAENRFRSLLRHDPRWKEAEAAFDRIARIEEESRPHSTRERLLEGAEGFGTRLFSTARTLVRAATERPKPNHRRLPEFRDSARAVLEHGLFADTPVHLDLECVLTENALTVLCSKLGADDPLVRRVLAGLPPSTRARDLVHGSSLHRTDARRQLYDGGLPAIEASTDPLIVLARMVDEESRSLRNLTDRRAEITAQAHRHISEARFALEGELISPDANSTLRLSYGTVSGCPGPPAVPAFTTFRDLERRHESQSGMPPFDLTIDWKKRASRIPADTPLNFTSTHDITGGNSGSPMVNRGGELVGLVFDGNAPSLVSDFAYHGENGRAVSVHPAAILAALRHLLQADRILTELGH